MKQGIAFAGTCLLISIAAFLMFVWVNADRLPERTATHFNLEGKADGWMPRTQHLWLMTATGVGMPLLMLAALSAIRLVPAKLVNMPHRDYWLAEERRGSTYAWFTRAGLWLGCSTTLGMGTLHELILRANEKSPPTLESGPVMVMATAMLACVLAFVIATLLHFRKPSDA
jgi:uncharacterized membrane protein